MDHFARNNGSLFAEQVPVREIAKRFGTPCYIYSRATIERHYRAFDCAFGNHPHLICYAVKANGNLAVLDVLARLGAGFDIVSVGELERVLAAGGKPERVVFSGVGKRSEEIERALDVGIRCFNLESRAELERLEAIAAHLGTVAPISIRVNPDVDPKTHPYISTGLKDNKFGVDVLEAAQLYRRARDAEHLDVQGIDCHIGSQLTSLEPFTAALDRLLELIDALQAEGIPIRHIDVGGGLGIRYRDEDPPLPAQHSSALLERLGERRCEILVEPGRAIVGNAGILVTRVEYLKNGHDKHFAIVDAGMNDLLRPALYSAWQEILPVESVATAQARIYDVVGPVCETADFLGKGRELSVAPGDLLAVRSSGAYASVMSSNYNARPRPAEVMVDGDQFHLVGRRESVEELYSRESVLPW